MLCLDVELRRRNNNEFGACDLMAEVVRRFSIASDDAEELGVDYRDIRTTLKACPGGSSMGPFLDRLVKQRALPNITKALSFFRLKLAPLPSNIEHPGWLGINTREAAGRVTITTYHAGSPLRTLSQVGDEILAIDGVRVRSNKHLQQLVAGRMGDQISVELSHEGILTSVEVTIAASPQHGVTLKGNGNERWKGWITTRQDP